MSTPVHDDIEEWLAASVTGGLSASEHEEFERHLAECEPCRALHEQEKTMSTMIGNTFSEIKPDPDFEARLARRFRSRAASRRSYLSLLASLFQVRPVRWAVAAVALLLLVKGGMVLTGEDFWSARSGSATPTPRGGESLDYDVSGNTALSAKTASDERDLAHGYVSLSSNSYSRKMTKAAAGALTLSGVNAFTGATSVAGNGNGNGNGSSGDPAGTAKANYAYLETDADAIRYRANANSQVDSNQTLAKGPSNALAFDGLLGLEKSKEAAKDEAAAPAPVNAPAQPPAPGQPMPAAAQPVQKLIRNARVEFEVAKFEAAADAVTGIAMEEQGYVSMRGSERGANGKLSGVLLVKVPPANLDGFLLRLRALGELKSQTLGAEDVTASYFDTDARLRNAQRMEQRLLDMLAKATGKVSDLLQVEKELARVRGQIEQMQGQLKYWDTLITYATVTVSLSEKNLDQPAAFLLREHANLSLFSRDVEKTYADAKREAAEANAQVLQSRLERDGNGRVTATLSVLLAPETADQTIARVKTLGRVDTFTTRDERVAKNGSGRSSDSAKVERDKVELNLVIQPDDESRRQTGLTVIAKQVDDVLDQAKAAAAGQGADILESNVTRDPRGGGAGQLRVRVPGKAYATVLAAFKKLGRVAALTVQRNDRAGAEEEDGPVLVTLALNSEEEPVQRTNLGVLTDKVEERSAAIKQAAAAAGVEVKSSTFERQSGGVEVSNLEFEMPMKSYAPFVEQIRGLGKVKDFTVNRNDTGNAGQDAAADENAPARIALQLYSEGNIVPDESGILPTIRHTLAQGAAALMWSVRMIGVALAFVAPWALALGAVVWLLKRRRTRGK